MNVSAKETDSWATMDSPTEAQPRNYVEKDFGIPADTVKNVKKQGPRKIYIDDEGDTYYGIIYDGVHYHYKPYIAFFPGWEDNYADAVWEWDPDNNWQPLFPDAVEITIGNRSISANIKVVRNDEVITSEIA